MPLKDIPQPDILQISKTLRLRKYDGDYSAFLPAYQSKFRRDF